MTNRPISSSNRSDFSCSRNTTPSVQPMAMNGSSRSSSPRTTSRREGNRLPKAATKSSSTSSGMIRDSGMKWISTGPATSAVPKPAMPKTM
ncbi:hypothetical protein D3C84_1043920 [compost metagenome]